MWRERRGGQVKGGGAGRERRVSKQCLPRDDEKSRIGRRGSEFLFVLFFFVLFCLFISSSFVYILLLVDKTQSSPVVPPPPPLHHPPSSPLLPTVSPVRIQCCIFGVACCSFSHTALLHIQVQGKTRTLQRKNPPRLRCSPSTTRHAGCSSATAHPVKAARRTHARTSSRAAGRPRWAWSSRRRSTTRSTSCSGVPC